MDDVHLRHISHGGTVRKLILVLSLLVGSTAIAVVPANAGETRATTSDARASAPDHPWQTYVRTPRWHCEASPQPQFTVETCVILSPDRRFVQGALVVTNGKGPAAKGIQIHQADIRLDGGAGLAYCDELSLSPGYSRACFGVTVKAAACQWRFASGAAAVDDGFYYAVSPAVETWC